MLSSKQALDPDKRTWHPSPLPGQIVLLSTINDKGQPNVAPKSWISMAAFEGPIVGFGCNIEHRTYQNIIAVDQYVINIPSERLVKTIWSLLRHHGLERLKRCGLTLAPAEKVKAPIIVECTAHLECKLVRIVKFGREVMIFGKIVAASIDRDCVEASRASRYSVLRPIFFLEDRTYGTIESEKHVHKTLPKGEPESMAYREKTKPHLSTNFLKRKHRKSP